MDIKEFIEKVELSDLMYLAWKESNLTPAQMEDAWAIIKSVLLDASFVADLPQEAVPLTEVLERPEHVALQYQEPKGSLVNKPETNPFVCSICKKDTSEVEYDYLSGFDHLECVLRASNSIPNKKETETKKVKTEKIGENSTKEDKTFLELLARGEYTSPKD